MHSVNSTVWPSSKAEATPALTNFERATSTAQSVSNLFSDTEIVFSGTGVTSRDSRLSQIVTLVDVSVDSKLRGRCSCSLCSIKYRNKRIHDVVVCVFVTV